MVEFFERNLESILSVYGCIALLLFGATFLFWLFGEIKLAFISIVTVFCMVVLAMAAALLQLFFEEIVKTKNTHRSN